MLIHGEFQRPNSIFRCLIRKLIRGIVATRRRMLLKKMYRIFWPMKMIIRLSLIFSRHLVFRFYHTLLLCSLDNKSCGENRISGSSSDPCPVIILQVVLMEIENIVANTVYLKARAGEWCRIWNQLTPRCLQSIYLAVKWSWHLSLPHLAFYYLF